MKFVLVIILILAISSLIIFESNNLDILNKDDMKTFSKNYQGWINETYSNVHSITANAIKLNWLPE